VAALVPREPPVPSRFFVVAVVRIGVGVDTGVPGAGSTLITIQLAG
jgi:hypothetical protein